MRMCLAFLLKAAVSSNAIAAAPAGLEFFEQRIRPMLAEHCIECHGPEKQKGGLRVDSRTSLLHGGENGPAMVPGKPEASLLLKAISHSDRELAMPSKKPRLPQPVIEDITRWIREGAPWPASDPTPSPTKAGFDLGARKQRLPWIWQTPRRQPIPTVPGTQAGTDIDQFIRARLANAGLQPALPTDDATWLRRAHFTITGLPPTRAELQAFISNTAPDRRAQAVDQLLASPHYGERWARHWMDLVRYAETRGHEFDFPVANAWLYRDYLIRAFNNDVPYERLVTEHLAGDLVAPRLNPATGANESVLATAWAFLGEETHSPVDIRQDECERVDNKVDVLSKTFLGLTVACARCHDHKFDALSQRDYYALSGFLAGSGYRQVRFETMVEHARVAAELENLRKQHAPRIAARVADALRPEVARSGANLLAALRSDRTAPAGWTNQLQSALTNRSHPLNLFAEIARGPDASDPARIIRLLSQASNPPPALPAATRVIADFTRTGATPWTVDGPTFGTAPRIAGTLLLSVSNATNPIQVMPYGAASRDPFWNRLTLAPGVESDSGVGAHQRSGRMIRTPRVPLESGQIHYLLRGKARVYAAVDGHIMVGGPLHGRLVATFDGGERPTWVSHDLTPYAGHRAHFEFGPEGDLPLDVLMVVESSVKPELTPWASWRPTSARSSIESLAEAFQGDLAEAMNRLAANRLEGDARLAALANWVLRSRDLFTMPTNATDVAMAAYTRDVTPLTGSVQWTSRIAPSLGDGPGTDEYVLVRGKHSRPGELAPRSLPTAFGTPAIRTTETSGRDELARQLTDAKNPLVARVMVNRVWQHVFGRGLVPTPDNFGYLGERPTHPELLDHLAWQFIHEDHWSLKNLIRRLVLTDTFAMGSVARSPEAATIDPLNLLWHRIPVRRLEGEAIRDSILAVSGRLNPSVGGPPIPIHLTEFQEGRGRPGTSGPLDGDGRRSVYGAIRRNFMPSMMVAFDFPTPFSTQGRRNRTNVPGQSLVLMNDPFVHQQAREWAGRMLREMPGDGDEARVRFLFESAFARPPSSDEAVSCRESLVELRTLHPGGNEKDVWSDFCHALFNANDFIYLK
jgi:mono/diheme cytochrome c family protein